MYHWKTLFVCTGFKDLSFFQGIVLYFISFKSRSELSPPAEYERPACPCLRGFFSALMHYSLTQTGMEKGLFLISSISNWSGWQSCTFSDSLLPPLQRDKLFTLDTSFRYGEVGSLAETSLLMCISQWLIEGKIVCVGKVTGKKTQKNPMANMAHNPVQSTGDYF